SARASFSTASRFHAAIWVGCRPCLGASSATVSWPLIASSATLALNSAENRLRVLMVGHPQHRRTYLSRLSQKVGPPLGTRRRSILGCIALARLAQNLEGSRASFWRGPSHPWGALPAHHHLAI